MATAKDIWLKALREHENVPVVYNMEAEKVALACIQCALDTPVTDPVVRKCREIVAAYQTNDVIRQQVLDGQWDEKPDFLVALAAYRAGAGA